MSLRKNWIRQELLSLAVGFVQHLSGRDNAILSGLLLGMRRREIETRLPAILDFSELGDFFEQPISTYSTGMTARLGFSGSGTRWRNARTSTPLSITETFSGGIPSRNSSRSAHVSSTAT